MSGPYLHQSQFENIFKNHLKIETYSKAIESLFSLRNRNRIDYKPYYQRNYVWDSNKATYFIESIILGTEIPPLIFFDNGDISEVIDGRQRFETIKLFMDGKIKLTRKGLATLGFLEGMTVETLPNEVREYFFDSSLRIISFEIVNEPRLDPLLQDKVKKEIFGRYNSGITPLRKAEIDNAIYDTDDLTNIFQTRLRAKSDLYLSIVELFFRETIYSRRSGEVPINVIMQFVRKNYVLHLLPVTYYAGGGRKADILKRLYSQITEDQEHIKLFNDFFQKIKTVRDFDNFCKQKNQLTNRLFNECFLWSLHILEAESHTQATQFGQHEYEGLWQLYIDNLEAFSDIDYAFYGKVVGRYNTFLNYLEQHFSINCGVYRGSSPETSAKIKDLLTQDQDATILDQFESLRLNKPDPSRTSIEDISRMMNRRKFLVRPSYQRAEVINIPKASAIIESILLGIALPAIFVYKRSGGQSEVIDGQQRILTILSYIGAEYIDLDGDLNRPKNSNFSLRSLKILKELENKSFSELSNEYSDKILDFELFVVSIEEKLNPEFDPIDLFIRLNDKPYPIKEHSFEMWNSWVDKELITTIRDEVKKINKWLYLRSAAGKNFRDRMLNEEVFTLLTFLEYKQKFDTDSKSPLDFFQKESRLAARIASKKEVTQMLNEASGNEDVKRNVLQSVKDVKSFVSNLRLLLIQCDIKPDENEVDILQHEFDSLLNVLGTKAFRRTFQDFYVLWFLLSPLTKEMLKLHRSEIRKEISNLILFAKQIPDEFHTGNGADEFMKKTSGLHSKYSIEQRKIRLSDAQIRDILGRQDNVCPLSGTKLFIGDEIEVDHIIPLSKGGPDSIDNMQIVHKDSNRSKGSNI